MVVRCQPVTQGRDLLLFLPGVDGLNIEAVDQFDYLSGTFDVWSLKVDGNDQSTFVELTERVSTGGHWHLRGTGLGLYPSRIVLQGQFFLWQPTISFRLGLGRAGDGFS